MIPNEVIIIGGGASINIGISLGLKDKLQDKFVIACNYAYKHFPFTFMAFTDENFYLPANAKEHPYKNPDIYEELKSIPLIIGINHGKNKEFALPNTILFKHKSFLKQNTKASEGFYTRNFLTGIFALSITCFLLNYKGIIYLLGFDWTKDPTKPTHYYSKEEINHRGIGYTNSYLSHKSSHIFDCYSMFKDIKIYNVSLNSNIDSFEKISYEKMFELFSGEIINQEDLRKEIKSKLVSIDILRT